MVGQGLCHLWISFTYFFSIDQQPWNILVDLICIVTTTNKEKCGLSLATYVWVISRASTQSKMTSNTTSTV